MTCNKDCLHCCYATLIKEKGYCSDKNSTCNGNCSNCVHYVATGWIWRCGRK